MYRRDSNQTHSSFNKNNTSIICQEMVDMFFFFSLVEFGLVSLVLSSIAFLTFARVDAMLLLIKDTYNADD